MIPLASLLHSLPRLASISPFLWAIFAHKKGLIDAKRGKLWSKLAKGIMVAAKAGGGDPNRNPRFRYAIIDAKAGNMPKDTIDRAIKKGTGDLEGVNFEEILYEGYGQGGVADLVRHPHR